MQLSIVIVNYNVRDLLMNAVASLYDAMEGIEGEIIVVDNASTDGAIEALNEAFPDVITYGLDTNLGFGGANNIGIERAQGEYILLLNPDTIVHEDTLRTMLAFMKEHPDVMASGCKIMGQDGSFDLASKRGFPSPWSSFCRVFGLSKLFPKSKLFGGYNLTYLDPDTTAEIEALTGCFMFFRGADLKKLEGFDTDFFMYGEDLDLCYRARKAGGKIYYYPKTSIIHLRGESTRRSSIDVLARFYEAMEIFARKHFRSNILMLWMIRLGIRFRLMLARANERFPSWGFAVVDVLAIMLGFVIGSLIRFGSVANYPDYAYPEVFLLPPLIFAGTVAAAGGYSSDDRLPWHAIVGYLLGFFVLSTLPYFFKDYQFSRGVVLVTTGVAALFGVSARFVWLLYKRTFGKESIKRIAFFSRQTVGPELRNRIRRRFFGRPVTMVGTIALTFSELDEIEGAQLGTVENIAKIAGENRLTDIFAVDDTLAYSDVIRAIGLTSGQSVRFHVVRGVQDEISDAIVQGHGKLATSGARTRSSVRKKLRDRLLALVTLLFGFPVVYLAGWKPGIRAAELRDVLFGKRALVSGNGTGYGSGKKQHEVFTVTSLYQDEGLSAEEIKQIDQYYAANQSFLLDCEIIISAIRFRNMSEQVQRKTLGKTLPHGTN